MKSLKNLLSTCVLLLITHPSLAKPVDDLKTAEAKQEEVIQYQILDGQIESVNKSTISAQTTGVISKLKYDVGDYVKKGDEIARISSQNQKAGMLEAKASVGKASANVSQAAATVSQAQASLKESQASYAEARSAFDQIKSIYQKRLIAKSQYDSAEAAMKSAAARVDAAKANLTATKAAYNSTKSGLNAAKAGLTKAGEQLGYTQLLAPYSGIVTERHVELGEVVAAGKPIMTGISLSEMRAIATIPQRIILAVRKHKSARVYVDGDNIGIPAKSLTIFPYADPSTNGFKVRAALDSGIKGLFPGVFVKVGFEIGKSTRLVVPQSAIAYRGEVTAVYVVDDTGSPHLRQVRLGNKTEDGKIQVSAGLDSGEKVALDPVHAAVYLKLQRAAAKEKGDE